MQDELDRAKANFKSDLKQIRQDTEVRHKEFDLQIRVLSESKTKIDNTTNIVRWGGIALLGWESHGIPSMTTRSMENTQKIPVLEKQSDLTFRTLEEIRNKLYERNYRESANEIRH